MDISTNAMSEHSIQDTAGLGGNDESGGAPSGSGSGNGLGNERTRLPPKPGRARFKPQLSCTLCRSRKLKCDRSLPCENCVKRDLASSCTYVHADVRGPKTIQKPAGVKDMQGRVRQLEELVMSLMKQTSNTSGVSQQNGTNQADVTSYPVSEREISPPPVNGIWAAKNALNETADSLGRIRIEDEQPTYVGGAHWAAILDSISGLKDLLVEETEKPQGQEKLETPAEAFLLEGPLLLIGGTARISKIEILAGLPPRPIVDAILDFFCETCEGFRPHIHVPTFRKEYEQFWADPGTTPVMWIGLLFVIMALSLHVIVASGSETLICLDGQALKDPRVLIDIYREKTVQCLILGNYTVPSAYTVETLLFYFFVENYGNPAAQVGEWILMGILVRAAMRLGYHRDASHYPSISVFRGEMQRRIWDTIVHQDLQTSSRVGLPRIIQEGISDAGPPLNLLDEEFDENTKVLPPSRPYTDWSPLVYMLIKRDIMRVYGMIVDQTSSMNSVSYDETMRLDALLEDTYQRIPELIKIRCVEDLKNGSAAFVFRNVSVDLCYRRARCVLHRKFVVPSNLNPTSPSWFSVKVCVEAALQILQSQRFIYEETKPGRFLHSQVWKTSPLMMNDFLLAAMLVCLYLSFSVSEPSLRDGEVDVPLKWTPYELLQTLEEAHHIWDEQGHLSKQAQKAAKALKKMLPRIRDTLMIQTSQVQSPTSETTAASNGSTSSGIPLPTMALTNGLNATSGAPLWPSTSQIPLPYQATEPSIFQPYYKTSNEMTDAPIEIDWESWDNQVHNNLENTPPDLWNFESHPIAFFDPSENNMEWVPRPLN